MGVARLAYLIDEVGRIEKAVEKARPDTDEEKLWKYLEEAGRGPKE